MPGRLRPWVQRSREIVLLAALTGALTGAAFALFERLIVERGLARLVEAPVWVTVVVPGAGLACCAAVLHVAGKRVSGTPVTPSTADEYLHAFHEPTYVLGARILAVRMVAAAITLASGNPMGAEGPALYAGAAGGQTLQRRFPRVFAAGDRHTLLVAGAAAGVAAVFKTPATGAIFALEVPYRDDLARRALLPALVGAAAGYLAFVAIQGTAPIFVVSGDPEFSMKDLLGALVLGVLCGLGARAFAAMVMLAKRVAREAPLVARIAGGSVTIGLVVLALHALTDAPAGLGSGLTVLEWLRISSPSSWVLVAVLLLRCLGTATAVGAGGAGGVFIPLVTAGALVGRIVGGSLDALDTTLFTVIGVAAFLGAGYRVPLAAVMFVAETTGRPGYVVPGLIAAVAAELMMGTSSVTAYQVGPSASA